MDIAKKNQMLQFAYAGVLADTVLQLGREGVLEKVTERKRKEQMAGGKAMCSQMGIEQPERVFTGLYEVFGCAPWEITPVEGGFTAEASGCRLCAMAKRLGAPSPCSIYCLNPMEGMIKALNPDLRFEVRDTLWEGKKCRIEVAE